MRGGGADGALDGAPERLQVKRGRRFAVCVMKRAVLVGQLKHGDHSTNDDSRIRPSVGGVRGCEALMVSSLANFHLRRRRRMTTVLVQSKNNGGRQAER